MLTWETKLVVWMSIYLCQFFLCFSLSLIWVFVLNTSFFYLKKHFTGLGHHHHNHLQSLLLLKLPILQDRNVCRWWMQTKESRLGEWVSERGRDMKSQAPSQLCTDSVTDLAVWFLVAQRGLLACNFPRMDAKEEISTPVQSEGAPFVRIHTHVHVHTCMCYYAFCFACTHSHVYMCVCEYAHTQPYVKIGNKWTEEKGIFAFFQITLFPVANSRIDEMTLVNNTVDSA